MQVRKKREFIKIRKDELQQDEGAASAQVCGLWIPNWAGPKLS